MKVTYFPNQPHCYAFGGFEVQMLSAFEAAKSQGCEVDLLNPWNRIADFDIAHIWGFEISQYHNIIYSKRAQKKVVVTTLLPDFSSSAIRLRFFVSGIVDKVRILKKLTIHVDCFLAVNDVEKDYIVKYFNFPKEKIEVIPNIVSDIFLRRDDVDTELTITDYVLCVGNICQRKNQLNLVKACNEIGYHVLLIGNTIEGEEAYESLVLAELKKNPRSKWMKGVRENSNMLRTAYKNCKLFALVSYRESQPISVLEALALKCKVLLADKPYAYQSLFKNVFKVNPDNPAAIKNMLLRVNRESPAINHEVIDLCSKEKVGMLYKAMYHKIK